MEAAVSSPSSGTHIAPEVPSVAAPSANGNWLYWAAMFAASALGTNLGDFWADSLGLGLSASFASLAAITLLAIAVHRWSASAEVAAYWIVIVTLRAAATNVADYATHDLKLSYALITAVFAAATFVAGAWTRPGGPRPGVPVFDLRYWLAMFIAGLFGTAGGDWAAQLSGLYAAAVALTAILLGVIVLRNRLAASALLGYWAIVLAERCAGTPVGDALASRHGFHLGLPVAMLWTGGALAVVLAAQYASGWRAKTAR